MGSLSFLNQMFLAVLAVAALPLIIHLIQRRRIQQVTFGSVRFLRKMAHRVVQRRRITELLLILLRTAALAAVALAFARPFLWKPSERVGSATILGDEAALILIDNSYSMSAADRLGKAKKAALDMLTKLEPTSRVGVAAVSNQFALLCPVGSTVAEARAAIESIGPSWQATDLELCLQQAERVLAQRQEQHRRVMLISDFQRSAWANKTGWRLGGGTQLSVLDVGGVDAPNVFVERVGVPRLVVAGAGEVISARVSNMTDKPLLNAEVVFRLGEKEVEKRAVSVQPWSSMPVHFRHNFTESGDVTGTIAVKADDALPADNVAGFCVHVTPRVRVLLVNGDPDPQLVRNDGFFITMALAPDASSPFAVRELVPDKFSPADLKDVDVIVLANVGEVSKAAAAAITKFVQDGGGAAFICGGRIDPDKFNASLGEAAPCRLWKLAMEKKDLPAVLSTVDLRHEVFAPFAEPRSGDLAAARFTQFFQVKDNQAAMVLARFNTGQPALLERRIGKGKSILCTSAMDLEWNDLCLKSVFVPLVQQVATRLSAEQTVGERNVLVGQTVNLPLPAGAQSADLTGPGGKQSMQVRQAGEGESGGGLVGFTPDRPGVYEIAAGGAIARYAVNLEPLEPVLRHLDPAELVAAVQGGPVTQAQPVLGAAALVAKGTARERAEAAQRAWMWLVAAAMLALAAEMLIAARTKTT